ncbi:MAG TPA: hypothetical protein VFZ63_00290 [Jiangellaceae bacterium]
MFAHPANHAEADLLIGADRRCVVVLLGGALLAPRALRRRDRRWVRAHVRAAAGTAAVGGLDVAQSPVDSSPPILVVRMEPHADRGTQVLEEVDQ